MSGAVPASPEAVAELGRRVRAARKARGMTQFRLALASGVQHTSICYVENARRTPSLGLLLAMARVLDTDPAVLVTGLHLLDSE